MIDITNLRQWVIAAVLALTASYSGAAALAGPNPTSPKAEVPLTSSNATARKFEIESKSAYRAKNLALAITLMRKAVDAAPKDGALRTLLGRMLLQSNDPVSAERELRQARRDGAEAHFVLPKLFEAMLARHKERNLLNEFPEPASDAKGNVAADVLMGRAQALLAMGSISDAVRAMDRSLTLRRDVPGLLVRADIATRQKDSGLANHLIDEAVKLEPQNGQALGAKLEIFRHANNNVEALALIERIIKLYPNDLTARLVRIDILITLNQLDRAQTAVDGILASVPKNAGARYYKAVILARRNNPTGAWRVAQSLPAAFTQSKPAYAREVAKIAVEAGNTETGASVLAGALTKFPEELDLRLRLADLRMGQNSPQAAIAVLFPVKDSNNPRILDLLARANLKLDNYADASVALNKLQKTNAKRAVDLLNSALRLEPGAVPLMDALGWIKLQQKDVRGALEQLKRAHSLRPRDGAIAFHFVQALDASGDRKAARAMLKGLLDSGESFDDLSKAQQLFASWH